MNDSKETKSKTVVVSWVLQVALAALFLMAALPKLSGDPMAAAIMAKLGLGSWSAYLLGAAELLAVVLLLIPRTIAFGAIVGVGILSGAIVSHLTVLGISLGDEDGGGMFTMAIIGWAISAVIIYLRRAMLQACFANPA